MDNKTELLLKIKNLAENGSEGEKENARKLLEKLKEKYNVTEKELDNKKTKIYTFKYKNDTELKILMQTIYKVTNDSKNMFYVEKHKRKLRNTIGTECTELQNIEIEFLYDFYMRTLQKDINLLINSFIQKHKIFGEIKTEEKEQIKIDDETIIKMLKMMESLSDDTPTLQINEVNE